MARSGKKVMQFLNEGRYVANVVDGKVTLHGSSKIVHTLTHNGDSVREGQTMDGFPKFMKSAANRIATSSQSTPGVEGYVYDGADGTQMAFWTCHETAVSAPHVHDFDEYMVVVQGCYTLVFSENRVPVMNGEEYVIPKGTWHGGEVVAGTRTIHAFGGRRAERLQHRVAHPSDD